MADIELVIKIPENVYKYIQQMGSINMLDTQQVANAIFDGTPLPKGHGDLIDKSVYRKEFLNSKDFEPMKILDLQEIIIKADKENVIEDAT